MASYYSVTLIVPREEFLNNLSRFQSQSFYGYVALPRNQKRLEGESNFYLWVKEDINQLPKLIELYEEKVLSGKGVGYWGWHTEFTHQEFNMRTGQWDWDFDESQIPLKFLVLYLSLPWYSSDSRVHRVAPEIRLEYQKLIASFKPKFGYSSSNNQEKNPGGKVRLSHPPFRGKTTRSKSSVVHTLSAIPAAIAGVRS